MKWEEVRRLYPDQFVKLRILGSRREGNREYVDDVAIVRSITDAVEATSELMKCRDEMGLYLLHLKSHIKERRRKAKVLFLTPGRRNPLYLLMLLRNSESRLSQVIL